MRRKMIVFLVLMFGLISGWAPLTMAQGCLSPCNCYQIYDPSAGGFREYCDCCDSGGTGGCAPSYYVCNNPPTNCCLIGSGTGSSCPCGETTTTSCTKQDNCNGTQGSFCGYDNRGLAKYNCTNTTCNDCPPACTATVPGTPALVSPANLTKLSSNTVNLDWGGVSFGTGCPSNTNQYKLYVEAGDSTPDVLVATLASNVTIRSFTGSAGNRYYWRVVATNGSESTSSSTWSFYTPGNIAGTVYYDENNVCSTSTPQEVGGALTAVLRDTAYSGAVATNGTYSITVPMGTYNYLDLGGVPAGYMCSTGCTQGCPTKTSVVSPSVGNNFFLTHNAEAWWQAVGAGVYAGSSAGGVTIASELPGASSRLVVPGTNDLAAVVRASGTVDTGAGEVSDEGWSVRSAYKGKTMDYRYFSSLMGINQGTVSDFTSGAIEEAEIVGQDKDMYYAQDPVDGEVSLGDVWAVTSGESYVIFVDGDLEINRDVSVEEGGFLAFIVNGGVNVASSVTDMQGMYVMDETFVTESQTPVDDVQLVVEGSVVAWGGVSLGRSMGGEGNWTGPAEQFVYRPDLLVNMPDGLKNFALNWQEVVPGSF